jgi:hypothetical protein
MEGSVTSFLKGEWKVSDTGSAHWTSSLLFVWKSRARDNRSFAHSDMILNLYVLFTGVISL